MTPIHLLEGERAAVTTKPDLRRAKVDGVNVAIDGGLLLDAKQSQLIPREFVAWQGIRPLVKYGPAAAAGRGLDQVNVLAFSRLNSKRHERHRIG